MRYLLASGLFLALFLPLAAPAQAQVRVDSRASGFRYVLGDLVPGDAFTPEARLAATSEAEVSGSIRVSDWHGDFRDDNQFDSGQRSLVLEQAWNRDLHSRTSYDPGGASPVLGLSVEILPHDQQSIFIDVKSAGAWMAFELSPQASITFELDVSMRLDMAPELDTAYWRGTLFTAMTLSAQDPGTGFFWDSSELRGWVGDTDDGPYQLEDAKDGVLTVAYTNASTEWVRGEVGYQARGYAEVSNDVSPVPEPSAWVMVAAGICLLGVRRRSVSRRASAIPVGQAG